MVSLKVNRWPKHIDAIIRSPQQSRGQDGHCGNFNLNANDDTPELILERVGAILPDESSFPTQPKFSLEPQPLENTLDDCPPTIQANARKVCQEALMRKEG